MARLRVHGFTITLDGFAAGLHQGHGAPLGDMPGGPDGLHHWMFETRTMKAAFGQDGGTTELDDDLVIAGEEDIGATIMGRNMFGPVRGPWENSPEWNGWWGPNPPYHHDVVVLTHHPRPPLEMAGGTTFHFVDAPARDAMAMASELAGGLDVRLGGGVATVRTFLAERLVDEMHLVVAPFLAGAGERLFEGLDDLPEEYVNEGFVPGESGSVVHARIVRRSVLFGSLPWDP